MVRIFTRAHYSLRLKPAEQALKPRVLRMVVLGRGGNQQGLHPSLPERMSTGKDKVNLNGPIILETERGHGHPRRAAMLEMRLLRPASYMTYAYCFPIPH